jgi:transcriptional regulator with XRE-family HTH domain
MPNLEPQEKPLILINNPGGMDTKLPSPVNVGRRIRMIRKDLRYTQTQFSELVDISTSHLSKIEIGASMPGKKTAAAIANIGETATEWILFGTQPLATRVIPAEPRPAKFTPELPKRSESLVYELSDAILAGIVRTTIEMYNDADKRRIIRETAASFGDDEVDVLVDFVRRSLRKHRD